MSEAEIKSLLGIHKQADGKIFWIDPKVVDPVSGRAVGADNLTNAAGFDGQVFFNPVAGQVGNLPILAFDGPSQFRIDLALSKRIRADRTRHRVEVKGEAFNLTNTPSFFRGDMDINSTTFGRLTHGQRRRARRPVVSEVRVLKRQAQGSGLKAQGRAFRSQSRD